MNKLYGVPGKGKTYIGEKVKDNNEEVERIHMMNDTELLDYIFKHPEYLTDPYDADRLFHNAIHEVYEHNKQYR